MVCRMFERTFPRALGSLEPMFAFVTEFASAQRLSPAATGDLTLIAEELFTNCVKYGGGPEGVAIGLDRQGAEVTLRLVDPGARPFDPTAAPAADVAAPIEARRAGGLGIHLVRSIARELRYAREGGANVVTAVIGTEGAEG